MKDIGPRVLRARVRFKIRARDSDSAEITRRVYESDVISGAEIRSD